MEVAENSVQVKASQYDCLLFDLDDTLYPYSSGLQAACRRNIQDYMLNVLGIDEKEVPTMCVDLYKSHGTTMAGLKALGYKFDNDHFHSYVHGSLPYENLRPDPVLRSLLLSMPQRKIVFTNSDRVHAAKALNRLGLEDCFEGIICFETLNPPVDAKQNDTVIPTSVCNGMEFSDNETCNEASESNHAILCKPSVKAIEVALKIANVDPKTTLFFDDSMRNIAAGKVAGLHCVLVGSSTKTEGADFALESIHNIREAIPEIWEGEEISETDVCPSQGVPIETLVIA